MTRKQRIPSLPRDEWTDEARRVFAYWEGQDAYESGSKSNVMMAMAQHPKLAMPALDMGRYILAQSTLTEREKELIVLRVAWRFDSEHQWVHHVISARRIGMSEAEIETLATESADSIGDDYERALIEATDQLCRTGRISDEIWKRLSAKLDMKGLMDVIYSIGFFAMNAWAMGAMQLESEVDTSYSRSATERLSDS